MTNRNGLLVLLPVLFAQLAGCSDGPVGPDAPEGVASVAVSPADLSLEVGATASLTATPLDGEGEPLHGYAIAWTSTDTTVASVSSGGVVSARGAGTATIRASSQGKSGRVSVTVSELAVAWIEITPAGGWIAQAIGTSRQLGVVARALNGTEITGRPVAWSSINPAVASVGTTGLLQAHAWGTTTITAVVDGKRDSTLVSVPSRIARIEVNHAQLTLGVGDPGYLTATAFDAQGGPLERAFAWSSSNVGVATVHESGRVVATGAGSAVITVTSEGMSATVQVTVRGTEWRLTDAARGPLPAILYTTTIDIEGVEREARWEATGGTLRFLDGRYRLRIHGRLLVDGRDPVVVMFASDGVVAYDVFTGAPMLHEGDEWANEEPRFRTRIREDGAIEVDWSREPGAPIVPLGFAK